MLKRLSRDILLILAIIIFAAASFVSFKFLSGGNTVTVSVDGVKTRYPLYKDATVDLGGCVLTIEDGSACISSADCPEKTCVRRGKISRAGQTIVCVPNKITVTVDGKALSDAPDFVQ